MVFLTFFILKLFIADKEFRFLSFFRVELHKNISFRISILVHKTVKLKYFLKFTIYPVNIFVPLSEK